jgi:hypothetical protein
MLKAAIVETPYHILGCVRVVMANADYEFDLIVNATILGTITLCISTFETCEMGGESRLEHTSWAAVWVGISANSWQDAGRAALSSTHGPLLCSTDDSPSVQVRDGRHNAIQRHGGDFRFWIILKVNKFQIRTNCKSE